MMQKQKSITPVMMLWFLAFLGIASTVFSIWGLWRITDLSVATQHKDDRALVLAINLKEDVAAFSMLTYEFLLQHDFNRMLLKEKQSNQTRNAITQNLGNLALLGTSGTAGTVIEAIRYNISQFLTFTDTALETAVEDGNAVKARMLLQDQVEPALRAAQESLSHLIHSQQKMSEEHFQFVRYQSLVMALLLIGLTALAMAVVISLRSVLLQHSAVENTQTDVVADADGAALPRAHDAADDNSETRKRILEARSLATLALINRLNRLHKDSEDLKKDMQALQRHEAIVMQPVRADLVQKDIDVLQTQGEKITLSIGRIQNVSEQGKQFVDSMGELMHGMQSLATDGNVVALNVTIELAKLQAQMGAQLSDEKNAKISEQIRSLATTAAGITGRMAMVLSQFRYAQQDIEKQAAELSNIKNGSSSALENIKNALHAQQQKSSHLLDDRSAMLSHIPDLAQKVAALEEQITQIQAMTDLEIDDLAEMPMGKQFKIIAGGAS